jgi:hypothetical protein
MLDLALRDATSRLGISREEVAEDGSRRWRSAVRHSGPSSPWNIGAGHGPNPRFAPHRLFMINQPLHRAIGMGSPSRPHTRDGLPTLHPMRALPTVVPSPAGLVAEDGLVGGEQRCTGVLGEGVPSVSHDEVESAPRPTGSPVSHHCGPAGASTVSRHAANEGALAAARQSFCTVTSGSSPAENPSAPPLTPNSVTANRTETMSPARPASRSAWAPGVM